MNNRQDLPDRYRGVMVGTAVGDALGLPAEGLARKTIEKLGWSNWRHRLCFSRGMISDDTEHTFLVVQSLLKHGENPDRFQRSLAWRLRWWFLGLPAGVGLGTARAILKLWLFIPPGRSGVYSAGNGPAMRSAVIGVHFRNRPDALRAFVQSSTQLTHKDPRALTGALAVAKAAALAADTPAGETPDAAEFFDAIRDLPGKPDDEWARLVAQMEESLSERTSVASFAQALGLDRGVTGYVYHTVPVALYSWLRHYGDFRMSLTETLNCGGDTDTVGAITAALSGAAVGERAIPAEWIDGIMEWPRNVALLRKVADTLACQANGDSAGPVSYFWPALLFRNVFFLVVVVVHGLLRLVPPGIRRRFGV